MTSLIARFGVRKLIVTGMFSAAVSYALFLPTGLDSTYLLGMLPTFLLAGIAFGLAFGPLNAAATSGIVPEEQGLASGLVNTSFQFGGALVLAIATAVGNADGSGSDTAADMLAGFHIAIVVSIVSVALGIVAMTWPSRTTTTPHVLTPLARSS